MGPTFKPHSTELDATCATLMMRNFTSQHLGGDSEKRTEECEPGEAGRGAAMVPLMESFDCGRVCTVTHFYDAQTSWQFSLNFEY